MWQSTLHFLLFSIIISTKVFLICCWDPFFFLSWRQKPQRGYFSLQRFTSQQNPISSVPQWSSHHQFLLKRKSHSHCLSEVAIWIMTNLLLTWFHCSDLPSRLETEDVTNDVAATQSGNTQNAHSHSKSLTCLWAVNAYLKNSH